MRDHKQIALNCAQTAPKLSLTNPPKLQSQMHPNYTHKYPQTTLTNAHKLHSQMHPKCTHKCTQNTPTNCTHKCPQTVITNVPKLSSQMHSKCNHKYSLTSPQIHTKFVKFHAPEIATNKNENLYFNKNYLLSFAWFTPLQTVLKKIKNVMTISLV